VTQSILVTKSAAKSSLKKLWKSSSDPDNNSCIYCVCPLPWFKDKRLVLKLHVMI